MDSTTKTLSKNGYDDDDKDGPDDDNELTKEEFRSYRMLAARLNYMAQDNPMVQYSAKEVCRAMSGPTAKDFANIKKVVRFLKGLGAVTWKYSWQDEDEFSNIVVYVDSDWAGCKKTRRSTTGGVIKVGQHVLRTWSATQPTIATSSGEAELIAMADGASRGLGLRAAMDEMGVKTRLSLVQLFTDSSVAKSFVSTRGLGKMRHLEVKLLWLQECVRRGKLLVGKVSGSANVADALTKYQGVDKLALLCNPHGIWATPVSGPSGEDRRTEGGCRAIESPTGCWNVCRCSLVRSQHCAQPCIRKDRCMAAEQWSLTPEELLQRNQRFAHGGGCCSVRGIGSSDESGEALGGAPAACEGGR